MQTTTRLIPGHTYHLFARGNNRENLFYEAPNYAYFLRQYSRHVWPVAETFAYCLLKNHFHLLVRIREQSPSLTPDPAQVVNPRRASQAISNFLNAYAKAINKVYGRTGSLFQERFRRLEVTDDRYFQQLVFYIHFNPQKHGFVDDFRDWPWSSYGGLTSSTATLLAREETFVNFGSRLAFEAFHRAGPGEGALRPPRS